MEPTFTKSVNKTVFEKQNTNTNIHIYAFHQSVQDPKQQKLNMECLGITYQLYHLVVKSQLFDYLL